MLQVEIRLTRSYRATPRSSPGAGSVTWPPTCSTRPTHLGLHRVPHRALAEDPVQQPPGSGSTRRSAGAPTWSGSSPTDRPSSASSEPCSPSRPTSGPSPAATSVSNRSRPHVPMDRQRTIRDRPSPGAWNVPKHRDREAALRPDDVESARKVDARTLSLIGLHTTRWGMTTTNPVDRNGLFGGKPLVVIDLATMSKSHDHDQEHVIGNGVDDAVVTHAHPIARTTSQRSGCWRPRVAGK